MKHIFLPLILMLLICISSCKTTQYVPVEKIEKEYIHTIDSIYVQDSIWYSVTYKHDTVFETKYKYKTIEKYKIDTLCRVDSIPVIVEVEKIVKDRSLYWWQKCLCWLGFIAVLYALYKILKLIGVLKF